ncbi:hypothetical protein ACTA71_009915 [Dictyostelium dimigraforme]
MPQTREYVLKFKEKRCISIGACTEYGKCFNQIFHAKDDNNNKGGEDYNNENKNNNDVNNNNSNNNNLNTLYDFIDIESLELIKNQFLSELLGLNEICHKSKQICKSQQQQRQQQQQHHQQQQQQQDFNKEMVINKKRTNSITFNKFIGCK